MKSSSFKWAVILFLLFAGSAYGQYSRIPIKKIDTAVFTYLENCGKDNDPALNNSESNYMNAVLAAPKRPYDFTHKKVAFVTGSSGKTISSKQAYFDSEKKRVGTETYLNGGDLVIFNEAEQKQSGGYDAAIVFGAKVPPLKKGVIRSLKKQSQHN